MYGLQGTHAFCRAFHYVVLLMHPSCSNVCGAASVVMLLQLGWSFVMEVMLSSVLHQYVCAATGWDDHL